MSGGSAAQLGLFGATRRGGAAAMFAVALALLPVDLGEASDCGTELSVTTDKITVAASATSGTATYKDACNWVMECSAAEYVQVTMASTSTADAASGGGLSIYPYYSDGTTTTVIAAKSTNYDVGSYKIKVVWAIDSLDTANVDYSFELSFTCEARVCNTGAPQVFYVADATEGTVSSGTGTTDYGNLERCQWVVNCGTSYFKIVSLDVDTEAGADELSVIDALTQEAFVTFSGTESEYTLQTPLKVVVITFHSDDSVSTGSYSMGYQCVADVACSSASGTSVTFTDVSGTIISDVDGTESSGMDVFAGESCTWTIECPTASSGYILLSMDYQLDVTSQTLSIVNQDDNSVWTQPDAYAETTTLVEGTSFTIAMATTAGTTPGFALDYTCMATRCSASTATGSTLEPGTALDSIVIKSHETFSTGGYLADEVCVWVVDCGDLVVRIGLWTYFDLGANDFIRVLDADDDDAEIYTFGSESAATDGDSYYGKTFDTSKVKVRFTSNDDSTGEDDFTYSLDVYCVDSSAIASSRNLFLLLAFFSFLLL